MLLALLVKNNTQIYKTVLKQLQEVYGFKTEYSEPLEGIVASRATFTAKSISDTLYQQVKQTIHQSIQAGKTDLREIKQELSQVLSGQKDWKVDQIARSELSWAYGDCEYKTYKTNGIGKVQWVAGKGACELCMQNANKTVGVNELFPSGHTHEPAHVNCACQVIPLVV